MAAQKKAQQRTFYCLYSSLRFLRQQGYDKPTPTLQQLTRLMETDGVFPPFILSSCTLAFQTSTLLSLVFVSSTVCTHTQTHPTPFSIPLHYPLHWHSPTFALRHGLISDAQIWQEEQRKAADKSEPVKPPLGGRCAAVCPAFPNPMPSFPGSDPVSSSSSSNFASLEYLPKWRVNIELGWNHQPTVFVVQKNLWRQRRLPSFDWRLRLCASPEHADSTFHTITHLDQPFHPGLCTFFPHPPPGIQSILSSDLAIDAKDVACPAT